MSRLTFDPLLDAPNVTLLRAPSVHRWRPDTFLRKCATLSYQRCSSDGVLKSPSGAVHTGKPEDHRLRARG